MTIANQAAGQPISPPVVATHRGSVNLFRAGQVALPEIEALAEDGNQSLLGPSPLAGDPNGNENDAVDTNPTAPIGRHAGIQGTGDLLAAHDWQGGVAAVTVMRMHD